MAVQDTEPNKPVHLIYLCSGLVLFYLVKWTVNWIWGYFTKAPNAFYVTSIAVITAVAAGVTAYRNERIYGLVNEVAAELKKVTWPDRKEVRAATIVVIIMTIISACILGLFDYVWANVTQLIYG